ncbi:MAG: pyruvate kinase, partial [Alphaproteobacteria bacterium]|nr:pyruvate kinase [Alphaproteobacteria bacterium]
MRQRRSAKILATLGPSSSSAEAINALFQAGADAFRFNFSHGTHEDHQARYAIVREIEAEARRPISVVMDLQGPKLRVGTFEHDRVELEPGAPFRLDLEDKPGTE